MERAVMPEYPTPQPRERILDLLFPPVCVGCRRVGRWVCARCWPSVAWLYSPVCPTCGRPSCGSTCMVCAGTVHSLCSVTAVATFDGIAREAVHALKFHGRHAISSMMGSLMADTVRSLSLEAVIPVPLHRTRLRERGYDQAILLAEALGRSLGHPVDAHALVRTRATRQQAKLDAASRLRNVHMAFTASRRWNGESVLLADDVTTTGATLDAAADALLRAGAGRVFGIVFAHAP